MPLPPGPHFYRSTGRPIGSRPLLAPMRLPTPVATTAQPVIRSGTRDRGVPSAAEKFLKDPRIEGIIREFRQVVRARGSETQLKELVSRKDPSGLEAAITRVLQEPKRATTGIVQARMSSSPPMAIQCMHGGLGDCSICLEDLGGNAQGDPAHGAARQRLPCGHEFHLYCVGEWIATHRTCPFCRAVVPVPVRQRIARALRQFGTTCGPLILFLFLMYLSLKIFLMLFFPNVRVRDVVETFLIMMT